MISVIVGTDRVNSRSKLIAEYYSEKLKELYEGEVHFLALEDIDTPFLTDKKYKPESQSAQVASIQDKFFIGANKWIVVIPEYNGGLPGVFKSLIDAMSIREYAATFGDKKIAVAGVSAGKAGNLRGLDYLTNLFSYVKASVFKNRLPISQVETLIKDDKLYDTATKEAIDNQLAEFLQF